MLGLRHWHRRRKVQDDPTTPPERISVLKIALDILVYPAAFLAPLALLPQVLRVYSTQDVSGLSLATWGLLGLFNVLWLLYGYVHRETPIMLANLMFLVLHIAVVTGILLYS